MKAVDTPDMSEFDPPAQRAAPQRPSAVVDFPEFEPPPPKPVVPRELHALEDEWYVHDEGETVQGFGKKTFPRRPDKQRYVVSPLQESAGRPGQGPFRKEDAEELVRRLELVRETMER